MKWQTYLNKDQFGPWAVVTGASSGIGKEFAKQLAASGINVVLVARRLPLLQQLGKQLQQQYGVDYRAVQLDLSTPDFMPEIHRATDDLDIGLLVSNAGSGHPGEFLSHSIDKLNMVVRLNVGAHLALTHHFGQRFKTRGKGGVILVSAMGASNGLPYMANDSATKAYLVSLGNALHEEWKSHNVNITVVLPGPTDTPILDHLGFDAASMPIKPISVEQCVAEGLVAFKRNRATHLTGRINRIMNRLVPASISRKLLGKMIANGNI